MTLKKDIYLNLGHNIHIFRKKNGLGLAELAKKAGISGSFLGNIEKGHRKPTLYTIERIAASLGIGFTALFTSKEKDPVIPEDSRQVFEIMKLVSSKTQEEKNRILNILKQL